jgi:hypothetical protein
MSGICRSQLGKLLVAGSVRAFYARAKLAKGAKKRLVWDNVGQKKKTRYGSLEGRFFARTAHDLFPIPLHTALFRNAPSA